MTETCSPINGKRVERWLHEQLDRPLRWKKPRHIILTADLFGDWVTDEMLGEIFAAMALTPQHTYQVLTKRPDRMKEWFHYRGTWPLLTMLDKLPEELVQKALVRNGGPESIGGIEWPLRNVWLGVSVEDQKTADERIPLLLETPAAVRFLSLEPLLGPVDIQNYLYTRYHHGGTYHEYNQVDWVIVGGESGPNARPFDIAWARSIIRQCKDAGVPVFTKQLGAKPYDSDLRIATPRSVIVPIDSDWTFTDKLADRKGGDWSEWPDDVRIREFPK